MPSLMDVLAERLSERTGTTFRVVRVHDTGLRRQVVSYVVHVERTRIVVAVNNQKQIITSKLIAYADVDLPLSL